MFKFDVKWDALDADEIIRQGLNDYVKKNKCTIHGKKAKASFKNGKFEFTDICCESFQKEIIKNMS